MCLSTKKRYLFFFYHLMEWWLICEGVKEIELVHTGAIFWGYAWLWFCFSRVWMLLAPKDGAKLHRSRIKGDNLWKLSTLVTFCFCFCFCSSSLELQWLFIMDALKGKMPKMQSSKLSAFKSSICLLCKLFVVKKTKVA
jgi:hypothetical protein